MSYKDDLLKAADAYCAAAGRAYSGIGLAVLNDAKFIDRLQNGAGCTMDTYEKVMEWLKENTPSNPPPLRRRSTK